MHLIYKSVGETERVKGQGAKVIPKKYQIIIIQISDVRDSPVVSGWRVQSEIV